MLGADADVAADCTLLHACHALRHVVRGEALEAALDEELAAPAVVLELEARPIRLQVKILAVVDEQRQDVRNPVVAAVERWLEAQLQADARVPARHEADQGIAAGGGVPGCGGERECGYPDCG